MTTNFTWGECIVLNRVAIIVDDIHDEDISENSHIVYAGVSKQDDMLFATGGRVLLCCGFGNSIKEAREISELESFLAVFNSC